MTQRTEEDEGIRESLLFPPRKTAICTRGSKPGLITRASSLPPYCYPKAVKSARRPSTRTILKHILDTLQDSPSGITPVNVSAVARATSYSRPTVDRALAFGLRFKVIERVEIDRDWPSLKEKHNTKPVFYKSLWKLTTSQHAPSSKNSYKVQALASSKTGLNPSKNLRSAAMVKIRITLSASEQPRLTSAYGKYVWSKAATVAGIALLVHTASAMINDRTKTLPIRDAFAVVVQNINLACRSLDATERYLATLKREALPDDIDDLFKKPALANMDNYVETHNTHTHTTSKTPPRPHQKLKGALPCSIDESSNSVCSTGSPLSARPDEKPRTSDPALDEDRPDFLLTSDDDFPRTDDDAPRPTRTSPDVDARPRLTSDVDRPRPRAGPYGTHGDAVPRPFGPRRAARGSVTTKNDRPTARLWSKRKPGWLTAGERETRNTDDRGRKTDEATGIAAPDESDARHRPRQERLLGGRRLQNSALSLRSVCAPLLPRPFVSAAQTSQPLAENESLAGPGAMLAQHDKTVLRQQHHRPCDVIRGRGAHLIG